MKTIYYKIPKDSEYLRTFRRLFFSASDSLELFEFMENNKLSYQNFNNQWVPFSEILSMLPIKISKPELILKTTKNIQSKDNLFFYFVNIKDYKLIGDAKPIELVKPQIKIILYNKRKTELINELENNIYQNAVEQGNIEIIEGK